MTVLFTSATVLGAALLFVVQPMVARSLLPGMGGSPQVWNGCAVFFQAVVLFGYSYTHASARLVSTPAQVGVHAVALAVSLAALPLAQARVAAAPGDSSPLGWLLLYLSTVVGLPAFVVATTSPMLQRWYSVLGTAGRDPYPLYAASNTGSLLGLLSYPFVIERFVPLAQQFSLWRLAYVAYAMLLAVCAAFTLRHQRSERTLVAHTPGAGWTLRARWALLALAPSVYLLAVTMYLSTDLAPVPLLWVGTLALYLGSFIVAFGAPAGLLRRQADRFTPVLLLAVTLFYLLHVGSPLWLVLSLHLSAFAAAAVSLHGALADARPDSHHLTEYYLWVSAGGVLGGVFVTLAAPVLFADLYEYPVAILLAALLRRVAPGGTIEEPTWPRLLALAGMLSLTTWLALTWLRDGVILVQAALLMLSLCAFVSLRFSRRAVAFPVLVGVVLATGSVLPPVPGTVDLRARTFFGVYRVVSDPELQTRVLYHGTTIHGEESLVPTDRAQARTYYHPSSPVAQLIAAMAEPLAGARVGVVGLGVGSLAAYASAGQEWVFFELDPLVQSIAGDTRFFNFMHQCHQCSVVVGDARLSLERVPDRHFALLVLDAFSSHAIPVHLLTREAIGLYARKLAAGGALAFHISSSHFSLREVLEPAAHDAGLLLLSQQHSVTPDEVMQGALSSEWVVMTRDPGLVSRLSGSGKWRTPQTPPTGSAWSDDFADILRVVTFR